MQALADVALRGRHVLLEPLGPQHGLELWPAASERDIWRFMAFEVKAPKDLDAWIARRLAARRAGTALAFLQRDATTGVAFGSTSLFDVDQEFGRAEIGHTWIGASHRRTSANTEAKLLLLRHAFEGLGLGRVQFKCDVRNGPSERAILRLGATKEGVLRSFMILPDGHLRDTAVFSVLRSEWPALRTRLEARLARAVPGNP